MNRPQEEGAWLETNGEHHTLHGSWSVGRAAANTLVLDLPKVSRLHALIQLQNIGEFWLIDLGSSNGTFLNKRRVHQPVRLRDQDKIFIGSRQLFFDSPRRFRPTIRPRLQSEPSRRSRMCLAGSWSQTS